MTTKTLKIILLIQAILTITIVLLGDFFNASITYIFAFPFQPIAFGLRYLSLSSSVGNIISIIIYISFCISPIVYLMIKKYYPEDLLLVLLSIMLFISMYLMINPMEIGRVFGFVDFIEYGKGALGISIYTIFATYLIFFTMRKIFNCKTDYMLNLLNMLLSISCILIIFIIFGKNLWQLIINIDTLSISNYNQFDNFDFNYINGYKFNYSSGFKLNISYLFLVLNYIVYTIPTLFSLIIIMTGIEIVEELKISPYNQLISDKGQKIIKICKTSIITIMLSQITINLLQLLLGSKVHSSNYNLSIPYTTIIFMLLTMLISKYYEDLKSIKDDNDMII